MFTNTLRVTSACQDGCTCLFHLRSVDEDDMEYLGNFSPVPGFYIVPTYKNILEDTCQGDLST